MTNKNEKNPNQKKEEKQTKDILLIRSLLENAQKQIEEAVRLFKKIEGASKLSKRRPTIAHIKTEAKKLHILESGKIIEGLFDGQNMQGPDGKTYPIPPNYASKSKLVEGDVMKLTVMPDGSFVFKQIGPIDREKLIGRAKKDNEEMKIESKGKLYKVLNASLTYYKIEEGDEVTVVVPRKKESAWCAIDNVVKKAKENAKGGLEEIEEIKATI